jgi:hypothetical protein
LADLQHHLRALRNNNNGCNNNNNNNNNSNIANVDPATKFRIHWDFLPPGDAHNRCDAAAAHWKKPQKTAIRNFCVLTTVGHLAFACSELKNCYMIEADCQEFPDPLACLIEEPWMQNAFHFEYGVPGEEVKKCKCHCRDKSNCLHACCKKESRLPYVDITIQDREKMYVRSYDFFFL